MKTWTLIGAALLAASLLSACGGAATTEVVGPQAGEGQPSGAAEPTAKPQETTAREEPIRIACLLAGKADDFAWSQRMYEACLRIQEAYGEEVEIAWQEDLYQVVDIPPALRHYAEEGYDLIVGHGFGFQDPIVEAAPDYPDVSFVIGTGYLTAPNVADYDTNAAQIGYTLGTLAGLMTQTDTIGLVGAVEIPNIVTTHEAFKIAALEMNPDAKFLETYTGSFVDAEAAHEAALAMIDQGADIVFADVSNSGAIEAANERGVYFLKTSASMDLLDVYPETFLGGTEYMFDVLIAEMIADLKAGSFGPKMYLNTLQNGGLVLLVGQEEAAEPIRDQLDAVVQGIIDGSIEMPAIE